MLRRLFVGVALIAAFASMSLLGQRPATVQASPSNQSASLFFSDQKDGGEQVEFNKGEGVVWAHLDGVQTGANLSYILRLNGWDYKWGKLDCCKNGGGPVEFPVFNKDGKGKGIPAVPTSSTCTMATRSSRGAASASRAARARTTTTTTERGGPEPAC